MSFLIVLLDLLRFLEQSTAIRVFGVDLNELREALDTAIVLLELHQGAPAEIEGLHILCVHF